MNMFQSYHKYDMGSKYYGSLLINTQKHSSIQSFDFLSVKQMLHGIIFARLVWAGMPGYAKHVVQCAI